MPIYAYRCESCGFEKDVLQKLSDSPLTECPECGDSTFRKQVTAAGFQLKGSGWYVTDFRGGNSGKGAKATGSAGDSAGAAGESVAPASDSASTAKSGDSAAADGAGKTSSAAAAPASSSGSEAA